MASDFASLRPILGAPEQRATRIVFFLSGFGMSAWAPLVPFAKARAGLDDGTLGLLLLCLGIGSVMAMPVAGVFAARLGCRSIIIVSGAMLCLTLPLLAIVADPLVLAAVLLAFGTAQGAIDVAMNIQAIAVERASGRPMMSGFHAFFSLGGVTGAAFVTALIGVRGSPPAATICVVAVIAIALFAAAPRLLPFGGKSDSPIFAIPHGVVLAIGVLCFIAFLAEGAVLDWGAVFLTSVRGVKAAYAGWGYAIFSLAMTACRLAGDHAVRRLRRGNILKLGGLCSASGFALIALAPAWQTTLIGCALAGVGCANIVPVLFTSAGRQTAMPEHLAVSVITTFGYAGILAGPAAIGFVAQTTSLAVAFLILAAMQLGVAGMSGLLRL